MGWNKRLYRGVRILVGDRGNVLVANILTERAGRNANSTAFARRECRSVDNNVFRDSRRLLSVGTFDLAVDVLTSDEMKRSRPTAT